VKNAYGSSEFPGISVNGEVNENVELELVPVPEHDVVETILETVLDKATGQTATVEREVVKVRRGDRFDPSASVKDAPQLGEIRVRYKNNTAPLQYWRNPKATLASFRDGWYYTGDVGELDPLKIDERGQPTLRIVDRVSNMIELYVDGDSVWLEQGKFLHAVLR
jgi:long-chain acyl-CoA synthetase